MKFSTLLTASAIAIASSAASAEVPKDITATIKITQWVNDQIIAATNDAIVRFNEEYPNVTVETDYIALTTWAEYTQSFLNSVAAGDSPDIIATAIEGFAEMASKGVLLNLDDVVSKDADATAVLNGIEPNLLAGMRTRGTGELNFFPTEWNNVVVWYNEDMFDAAGIDYPSSDWTWEDFAEAAKALTIKDSDGNTTQFGYFVPGYYFGLQPWLFTNNASILNDDWTKATVDTPEFRQSLEFLNRLINVDGSAPAFEAGVGTEKFTAGQVAMFSAGHWPAKSIIDAGLKNVGVQYPAQKARQATVFGIGGVAITKFAENSELAWAFVKELTGPEYQESLATANISIPSARAYATTPEYVAWPHNAEIFYGSAAAAIPVPSPSNFTIVSETFMRHLTTYLNGENDIDSTISAMDRELQRAMRRVK